MNTPCLVFLTISLICCCKGVIIKDNVIFQKQNEIFVNDAKWLVTFVHDLAPYGVFINDVRHSVIKTQDVLNVVTAMYKEQNLPGYHESFKSLNVELDLLTNIYQMARHTFYQYTNVTPITRNKRSVLPIVGEAMSALFGTVSEEDLENINRNVELLATNQKRIIHDIESGLSILNVTQTQVAENRRALSDVVIVMNKLDDKIEQLSSLVHKQYYGLEKFIHSYIQYELIIEEIKQMMQNVIIYLENLKLELSFLSLNRLSINTIPPDQLRSILQDIEKELPPNYELPVSPRNNIWYYYNTLYCTGSLMNDKINIILDIPLLNSKYSYEIYNVINIHIPILSNNDNMALKYQLEANSFMISKDRSHYALLSDQERIMCTDIMLQYCNPRVGLFPINLSKLCLTALFLGDSKNINVNCKKVLVYTTLPTASYVENGLWVITTKTPLTFTIQCQKQNHYTHVVQPPMNIVHLPNLCSADSGIISLPKHNTKYTSDVQIKDTLSHLFTINITKFHIWKNMTKVQNISKLEMPLSLRNLKEIPVDDIYKHVYGDYNKSVNLKGNSHVSIYVSTSISVIVMVAMTALFILCRKKRICFRNKKLANGRSTVNYRRGEPRRSEVIELEVVEDGHHVDQ